MFWRCKTYILGQKLLIQSDRSFLLVSLIHRGLACGWQQTTEKTWNKTEHENILLLCILSIRGILYAHVTGTVHDVKREHTRISSHIQCVFFFLTIKWKLRTNALAIIWSAHSSRTSWKTARARLLVRNEVTLSCSRFVVRYGRLCDVEGDHSSRCTKTEKLQN